MSEIGLHKRMAVCPHPKCFDRLSNLATKLTECNNEAHKNFDFEPLINYLF